jgi:fatty acid desaturase
MVAMVRASRPGQHFRLKSVLSADEVRALVELSNWRSVPSILLTYSIVAGSFALVALAPGVLTIVIATILIGGRQVAMGVLAHDAAHRTLFASRNLNDFVGQWLLARPIWADMYQYRTIHLRHHVATGTLADPDLPLVVPYPMRRSTFVGRVLRDLLGVTALMRVATNVLVDLKLIDFSVVGTVRIVPQQGRSSLDLLRAAASTLGTLALVHAVMFSMLWLAGHPLVYLVWWLAWGTTMQLFARLRGILEHACTPDVEHPLKQSRSTGSPLWARLMFTPHNINHHVEHHLLMTVPFYRLPQLQRLLRERGLYDNVCYDANPLAALLLMTNPSAAPPRPERRHAFERWQELDEVAPITRGGRTGVLPMIGGAVARIAAAARRGDSLEQT